MIKLKVHVAQKDGEINILSPTNRKTPFGYVDHYPTMRRFLQFRKGDRRTNVLLISNKQTKGFKKVKLSEVKVSLATRYALIQARSKSNKVIGEFCIKGFKQRLRRKLPLVVYVKLQK